ncbi:MULTISPECIES: anhydro-N-acetylmuramic acid kinase AnmK [Priestia]|jgi:anhydro-N-acetylmuramic acid kinase|uniref:Anhydro-N-acetylmuramic acid kinase n=1 Tax=Priestia megaterium TaxID=1404 RepID=A0ABD4WRD0_PRIMG|nr:anhydro-N-acetylmuramic acid kinase AnmK [Priestia megaterium]KRF52969.1 anhydro-N-acetylmuramic acid kinase [Bacillus sp. Soil531]MCF6794891.1 anhydro-N-acetylmuramic acid kinase [Bacillus sp. ET1]MBD8845643.1 anhydro-N-acetylmuramic acid kinase [Priestia megaterium]MDD9782774.1 anhydro-N-acetylmuramic acid kinase AnmK [Priestia megaterium]MDN4861049.1 anhydro-N-acetylmuramic acid kinase AnmK [Priestia megaterium]
MYAVGLMSGTSLDGIDAALVQIEGSGYESKVKLLHFITMPFSPQLKKEIEQALSFEHSNVQLICSLNFKLGYAFADAVKKVCQEARFSLEQIDVIGSHGQTIYHQPYASGSTAMSTLQIGEPAVIAYETKTKVVANFRVMDMAAGGQGAPLVPHTERILYSHNNYTRLLQNIGGIGNVTLIPPKHSPIPVVAFDTGPGNMMIDEACQQLFNVSFDENGRLAAGGKIISELLEDCMNHDYMKLSPPKSTGRELFGTQYTKRLLEKYSKHKKEDLLATITMFTASSIVHHYETCIFPAYSIDEVIIGGGGSYNNTLMNMIKAQLGKRCRVYTQEEIGMSSEAKEAVAFAVLANETLSGYPSNVPSATGALSPVILGNITPAPL